MPYTAALFPISALSLAVYVWYSPRDFLASVCGFWCFSNTFATLELATVIELLGIASASGPLGLGKHSEKLLVVSRHFSVRYLSRAMMSIFIQELLNNKNIQNIFSEIVAFFLKNFPSNNSLYTVIKHAL